MHAPPSALASTFTHRDTAWAKAEAPKLLGLQKPGGSRTAVQLHAQKLAVTPRACEQPIVLVSPDAADCSFTSKRGCSMSASEGGIAAAWQLNSASMNEAVRRHTTAHTSEAAARVRAEQTAFVHTIAVLPSDTRKGTTC